MRAVYTYAEGCSADMIMVYSHLRAHRTDYTIHHHTSTDAVLYYLLEKQLKKKIKPDHHNVSRIQLDLYLFRNLCGTEKNVHTLARTISTATREEIPVVIVSTLAHARTYIHIYYSSRLFILYFIYYFIIIFSFFFFFFYLLFLSSPRGR